MTFFKEKLSIHFFPKLRPLRNNLHVSYPDAPVFMKLIKTYNQVVSACLIHSPDGDFAITFWRATEYVSVLCWEESLNSVFMGLKLLLNPSGSQSSNTKIFPTTLLRPDPTTTTNPDLMKRKRRTMSCACVVYGMAMEMSCKRSRSYLIFHSDHTGDPTAVREYWPI